MSKDYFHDVGRAAADEMARLGGEPENQAGKRNDPIAALKSWLESDSAVQARDAASDHLDEHCMYWNSHERGKFIAGSVFGAATTDARTLVRAAVAAYEAEIEHLKGWLEVYQDIATEENR